MLYSSQTVFNFLLLDFGYQFISIVCSMYIGIRHGIMFLRKTLTKKSGEINYHENNKTNVLDHLDPLLIDTIKDVVRDEF